MADRTDEFFSICNRAKAFLVSSQPQRTKLPIAVETAHFTSAASEISKEVHSTSTRLQELALLIKQSSLFNDSSERINELVSSIKGDISSLNMQLDNMQAYVDSRRTSSESKQSVNHSEAIVSQMKTDLLQATKGFKDILQVRQENMRIQQDRRALYGRAKAPTLGKPLMYKSNRSSANSAANTGGLPRPQGVYGEDSDVTVPLIVPQAQQQLETNANYLQSREEAVVQIETHIVELGQIFNRLAGMIHEQDELVQRIDDNVEETLVNVNTGQNELLRYLNSVSSNRLLVFKIFLVLLTFIVFFMLFLA